LRLEYIETVQARLLTLVKRIHTQLRELTYSLEETDIRPISFSEYVLGRQ